MSKTTDLSVLADRLKSEKPGFLPVEKWHPDVSGDLDLVIKRDGRWIHEGRPIERSGLIRLFSSVLWREGDEYFLKTPVEKWRIQVEDVPFHFTTLEVLEQHETPVLRFISQSGDVIDASGEHPIRVVTDAHSGEPSPYLGVRFGMEGLISRSVFLQLADLASEEQQDGQKSWWVDSAGTRFKLGTG